MKTIFYIECIFVLVFVSGCVSIKHSQDEIILRKVNFLFEKILKREKITTQEGYWLWGEEEVSDANGFSETGAIISSNIYSLFEKYPRGFLIEIYICKSCNTKKYNSQKAITFANAVNDSLVCVKIQIDDKKNEVRKLCVITIPLNNMHPEIFLLVGNATIGNQLLIPQAFYDKSTPPAEPVVCTTPSRR